MMQRQAVVIGAGAIGMASAYYLWKSGWQVTIVDSGEVGSGCSYGNACLIVPSHSHPLPGPGVVGQAVRWIGKRSSPFSIRMRLDPALWAWIWRFFRSSNSAAAERGFDALVALSRASLELFEELLETDELDFFYERKGLLHVYCSEQSFADVEKEQRVLSRWGFNARMLSREETLSLEPALGPRIRGGLFVEGEAHGFCFGYVSSLAKLLEKQQARIIRRRAVSSISVKDGGVRGVYLSSPEEEIRADLVVLAAGAWSAQLALPLGIRIPLQPAKGYSCTVDHYPGSPRMPVLIPERRVIITPLADRLRFGGTLELAGFDPAIDPTRYRAVVDGALAVLRDPPPMGNEEAWCGFRPVAPDGLPIIDRAAGIDGLVVATGHAMLGFTQSPITGKLVAELAAGDPPSVPITSFRLDRF